jgi:flagellar protein FliS
MSSGQINPYLKTKILTASPEELRMMLYDGAIRFSRQGKEALEKQDWEAAYNGLVRAQKIVLELSTSLKHDAAPELCDKLSALYTYIYRQLVEATMERKAELVDEAIELLEYERETWRMLMQQLTRGGQAGDAASEAGLNGAQQTAISSLSISG